MSRAREALRQQRLVAALGRPADGLGAWLRDGPGRRQRGLQAYRDNAAAVAARALQAACPTLVQAIGAPLLGVWAERLWQIDPPRRGDLAQWGHGLPEALRAAGRDAVHPLADVAAGLLAEHPWLPDVAAVDLAVHRCEQAADGPPPGSAPPGLDGLGGAEGPDCRVRLAPGLELLHCATPAGTLWQLHRALREAPDDAGLLARLQDTVDRGEAEAVLVARHGWQAQVHTLPAAAARFTAALAAGRTLAEALADTAAGIAADTVDDTVDDSGGPPLDLDAWLLQALAGGWIAAIVPPSASGADAPIPRL